VLRQADQIRHFYLEADRGTEEHRRLVDKFVGYWWHLQDPRFADARDGRARVHVLFVTTTAATASFSSFRRPTAPSSRVEAVACKPI